MKPPPELFGIRPSVPPHLAGPGLWLRSILIIGKGDGMHGSKSGTVEQALNDPDQVMVPAWADNNRRAARMPDGGGLRIRADQFLSQFILLDTRGNNLPKRSSTVNQSGPAREKFQQCAMNSSCNVGTSGVGNSPAPGAV